MSDVAWEIVSSEEYEDLWGRFETRFQFRPTARGDDPGIAEPPGSITIDLSPIFDGERSRFAAGEDAVNSIALLAMTEVFPADQGLVVLDWQHSSHSFWPHRQACAVKKWPVEVFPDGDYHIFLTEDMSTGTFGHPWRRTLCIFGDPLVGSLAPKLSAWLPARHRAIDPDHGDP